MLTLTKRKAEILKYSYAYADVLSENTAKTHPDQALFVEIQALFIKAIAENDSGDIEIAMQLLIEQTKKINELKAKGLMNSEMLQEIVINAPKKKEIETKYAKYLAK